MAFLGTALKTIIDFRHDWKANPTPPHVLQKQALRKLLEAAAGTSFGIYYGFRELLESQDLINDFQARVPIHNYDQMHERWWRQQQHLPDITWPGRPDYFALSSGTTSKQSKRIPVTVDMLRSIRSVGISQLESLANFDLGPEVFEKDILMLSSSADLHQHENGYLEGEISGINVSNLPFWTDIFYKPGKEVAAIDNWDERIEHIVEQAPEWDVAAIAGIPSWVLVLLREIRDTYRLRNIHELWPNLSVFATGGVAFEPYRESFDQLLDHPLIYMDTYLASEGFFAFNARPDTMAMQLALNHGLFFEFIPFDERGFDPAGNLLNAPQVLTIADVEKDQDYALVISTCAGAWRYLIGDTVRITDPIRGEIRLSGRTKYFLNVVGSQLSEEKLNRAIGHLSEQLQTPINEFAVAALKDENGRYFHQWVLGAGHDHINAEEAAGKLDEILKKLNKNYGVARSKALEYVKVQPVKKMLIYDWLEKRKKKGGQIKLPKVMEENLMLELLSFLESHK